ncbi:MULTISPECIES: hypothetical protein [unclassified Pseudomonas]|uniref:hypothetical protein n=1 Tax=unclassified Pseudomonas TaxID=196821 RepID=UPI000C881B55|nr:MULTISPECIES: hypothetical protein [unclassified Pseudomonas]PNA00016.1 hypothetical protein C1X79_06445 [Pseudomonas sp. FW305-42]PNA24325.1 hypothetical protein C1X78_11955 [Pseudomonas sp. MPR-R1B]PNB24883.1 hypothetical protein C1X80_15505 [Pseudomonas sp. DP16D-E2]PNB42945.1 hypothetical protein C1X75_12930 [Pseudomonas sp. FW305-17]PNB63397.1 hypothetical protein C1X77_07255 [Pseudomonas sp. GW531-E2]
MQAPIRIVPDLAFALVNGRFEPPLPSKLEVFEANNTLFTDLDDGFLLESYQLLSLDAELKAPGIRLRFTRDGEVSSAHVCISDYLYEAKVLDVSLDEWQPEREMVDLSFHLRVTVGGSDYDLANGRFALVASTLIDSIDT